MGSPPLPHNTKNTLGQGRPTLPFSLSLPPALQTGKVKVKAQPNPSRQARRLEGIFSLSIIDKSTE